ncbi:MAG: F0F1 ATP synthase subunit A [Lachnospiraceae bacterium]|nr:F0F1 ATP synthase subunit A [Lachnospiraceae bacterium]
MDINISGPKVFWTAPWDVPIMGKFQLSETILVSWLVMAIITILCIVLTRDLKVENISKRQALAEFIVEKLDNFVLGNMGERFRYMIPFVGALFATSLVSNLISLTGLRSPTADLSTEAGWAIVVFIMITRQKLKTNGLKGYLKGFTEPIVVMTPFNILGEFSTPVSMACRHFGNIFSGIVINALIYGALAVVSSAVLGLIPGAVGAVLSQIPIFSVGLPAITSVYFDWFTGCMQAFIFSMLTIMYIAVEAGDE